MDRKGSTPFEPSSIFQVGIVVKNIDETVRFYEEVFGIGPFEIREVNYPTATFYGQTEGYRGKRAFAKSGAITFELIELIDGKTIHEAFLKEKGEGLHHLGFEVKDLKWSIEEAERRGLKVIQGFTREDGSGFAYLDSDKIGGVIFELIRKAPQKA
jgi:methylmalonyl-CoA/ethylmalonyl-CoA epimerase